MDGAVLMVVVPFSDDDCMFCGHHHPDREYCDVPICGDGCCHCGCSQFLPLDAELIKEHIREQEQENWAYQKQSREQAEEARKWRKRFESMARSRNAEIERRVELEKRLAKAQKKLGKK